MFLLNKNKIFDLSVPLTEMEFIGNLAPVGPVRLVFGIASEMPLWGVSRSHTAPHIQEVLASFTRLQLTVGRES